MPKHDINRINEINEQNRRRHDLEFASEVSSMIKPAGEVEQEEVRMAKDRTYRILAMSALKQVDALVEVLRYSLQENGKDITTGPSKNLVRLIALELSRTGAIEEKRIPSEIAMRINKEYESNNPDDMLGVKDHVIKKILQERAHSATRKSKKKKPTPRKGGRAGGGGGKRKSRGARGVFL